MYKTIDDLDVFVYIECFSFIYIEKMLKLN